MTREYYFLPFNIYIEREFSPLAKKKGGGLFPGRFLLLKNGCKWCIMSPFLADWCTLVFSRIFTFFLVMKAPMWRVCGAGVFPRYTGDYTRGVFFTSCRRGPGATQPPPPQIFWKINAIFTIWGDWYFISNCGGGGALKGVVFKWFRKFFL